MIVTDSSSKLKWREYIIILPEYFLGSGSFIRKLGNCISCITRKAEAVSFLCMSFVELGKFSCYLFTIFSCFLLNFSPLVMLLSTFLGSMTVFRLVNFLYPVTGCCSSVGAESHEVWSVNCWWWIKSGSDSPPSWWVSGSTNDFTAKKTYFTSMFLGLRILKVFHLRRHEV